MKVMRDALRLSHARHYSFKGFKKNVISCKRAELQGDYETAYKKLLDIFENHLESFGRIMRGNTISSHGAGPHFKLVFNFPYECLDLPKNTRLAIGAMYNLYMTGFPSVPVNYITRNTPYWDSNVPGDTSCFYIWSDGYNPYLGTMTPISLEEYSNDQHYEHRIKFDNPMLYEDIFILYKISKDILGKETIYLKCCNHYYKYTW